MSKTLNSLDDSHEKSQFKSKLHDHYSKNVLPKVFTSAEMNTIKTEMLAANQNLKSVFNNLSQLHSLLHGLLLFGIVIFSIHMIGPLAISEVVVKEEPVPDPTMFQRFMDVVGSCFDSLTGNLPEITGSYFSFPFQYFTSST